MNKIVSLMFAAMVIASCSVSETDNIAAEVNKWEGTEILFPPKSVFTIQGKDTVDFRFQESDFKILTYVDSIGCISCKLQLMNWSRYIHELDSIANGTVPVAFYIHAPNLKELNYITRRDGFTHPVCYDENDDLNKLNQFSSEMMFQTFLLDRDNRVVGIGNPVHNPNIKELYYRIISGGKREATTRATTSASLDVAEIDFGKFSIGEPQIRKITLTNTGSNLLVINDITTSCGCTEVEFSREPVRPGQSSEITVRYNPDETGFFSKTISIYCNTEESPLHVIIKGIVN